MAFSKQHREKYTPITLNKGKIDDLKKIIQIRNSLFSLSEAQFLLKTVYVLNLNLTKDTNLSQSFSANLLYSVYSKHSEHYNHDVEGLVLLNNKNWITQTITIIEFLGITPEELTQLKVIVNKDEKNRRSNSKISEERRNNRYEALNSFIESYNQIGRAHVWTPVTA